MFRGGGCWILGFCGIALGAGILIAIAPIVGTARVTAAAGNIVRALGFAIAVIDAEEDELTITND